MSDTVININESIIKWPCTCIACGFDYVWIVMSDRVIMQDDRTFAVDGELAVVPIQRFGQRSVKEYGYPVFWMKGRDQVEPPPFGAEWTQDPSSARHYPSHATAEDAAAEAAVTFPTLIGKLRAIRFRIR